MTLKVEEKNALIAWRKADEKGKALLENLYGKEVFENQNITDRIKSFEDAMEETGRPNVPDFSCLPADMRKHFTALYKMEVITEALNEGWKPNWDNDDEYKHYPWFIMTPSSFAFGSSCFDYSVASAGCGSRLKFRTSELAKYAAEQFINIWKDIQIG